MSKKAGLSEKIGIFSLTSESRQRFDNPKCKRVNPEEHLFLDIVKMGDRAHRKLRDEKKAFTLHQGMKRSFKFIQCLEK